MTHFLVPTDFSPVSHHALTAAVQLAQPLAGRITLLHAVELPPTPDLRPNVFVMKLLQAAKHQLQLLLREASQHVSQATIQELLQVMPHRTAILAALAQQPDMLVVGSAPTEPLSHTIQWLLRTAPCPVLVVRHPISGSLVRTVVFPTGFSVRALRAGAVLRRLQAFFPAAACYLLHVGAAEQSAETLAASLAQLAQQVGLANCQLAVVVAANRRLGIAQFAQRVQADMVVLHVGAAGWLWPISEDTENARLPPVLTFRLAEDDKATAGV
ncbi:hypothetical protein GO988_14480 [Hymenobacter sp. HMF4947]|uniref:UspA domain-containing protein n=1 Tax=Hymenobacter ginkgonis TaxID=2682976 RepID=A0A7K1TGN0_9BACT|nr:universal stress protein [Hymenobacter ginkgonis]MVN77539.1 hypothetical protein [Hymenobacter ginkgonis]